MSDKELDVSLLRELLRYDPKSGSLYWLPRPLHMFKSEKGFSTWNGKWAYNQGFTSTAVNGYKQGRIFGRQYNAHRVAWALHYGEWPDGQVDHINGVRTDNRIENLRLADNRRNQMNRASRGSSEFLGVSFYKSRGVWEAYIKYGGKIRRIGYFRDEVEAAKAYDEKARKHFGEYANPNFNLDGSRRARELCT